MAIGTGLDAGAESVKIVQVSVSGGKTVVMAAAKIARLAGGQWPADEVARTMAALGMPRRMVAGFSGKDLVYRYLSVPPSPPERLRMMVDFDVRENVAGSGDLIHDFMPLEAPVGPDGSVTLLAALARSAELEEHFKLMSASGIKPTAAVPSAVALARSLPGGLDDSSVTLALDIGRENVEIAIVSGPHLYFVRKGSGAGERLTEALAGALGIDRDKAERFKREKARVEATPPADMKPESMPVFSALREAGETLAGAVEGAVRFARVQTKNPEIKIDRVALSGGGALLAGLPDFLEKRLRMPVEVYDLARHFDVSGAKGESRVGPEFALAAGLALASAHERSISVALLPAALARSRDFWGRKVYAFATVALAAALAAAVAIMPRLDLGQARTGRAAAESALDRMETRRARLVKQQRELTARADKAESLARQLAVNHAALAILPLLRASAPDGLVFTEMRTVPSERPGEVTFELQGASPDSDEPLFLDRLEELRRSLDKARAVAAVEDLRSVSGAGGPRERRFVCRVRVRYLASAPEEERAPLAEPEVSQ